MVNPLKPTQEPLRQPAEPSPFKVVFVEPRYIDQWFQPPGHGYGHYQKVSHVFESNLTEAIPEEVTFAPEFMWGVSKEGLDRFVRALPDVEKFPHLLLEATSHIALTQLEKQFIEHSLGGVDQQLQDIITHTNANPDQKIVANLSIGISDTYRVTEIYDILESETAPGSMAEAIQEHYKENIYGEGAQLTHTEKIEHILEFVSGVKQSPEYKARLISMLEKIETLYEKNVPVIVAVSNGAELFDTILADAPDAERDDLEDLVSSISNFNELAQFPFVIPVAASTNEDDPADRMVDDFSSQGNKDWAPWVTAPGVDVIIDGNNTTGSGTSFSAPWIGALLVDIMHERQELGLPDITVQGMKDALRLAAVNTDAPFNREGYGMVDREAALAAALDWTPEDDIETPVFG